MSKSISSVDPSRTAPTEWLLSCITSRERATAIIGDLTEIAATRGRLWFWIAYARTLVALGWRTPAAVLAAIVSIKYLRGRVLGLLLSVIHFNGPPALAGRYSHLAVFSWIASLEAVSTLWILLPYAAIRFGLRNRLTYLAGILLLFAVPVYTCRPQVYQYIGLICAVIIVAALVSPLWRKQMIFLAANSPIHHLASYVYIIEPLGIFRPYRTLFLMGFLGMQIHDLVAIGITILIGPPLYRWLLQPRPIGGTYRELA